MRKQSNGVLEDTVISSVFLITWLIESRAQIVRASKASAKEQAMKSKVAMRIER